MLLLATEERKAFATLIRAVMPTQVTVEHKDAPPRNAKEIMRRMELLGVRPALLQELRSIEFHTPKEVLELTAEDVTRTDDDESGN